jgi:hypothetical protein
VIDGWSTGYDQAVEYQMWLRGNHRAVAADPTVPPDPDNPYSNLTFVMDGPVIAHAVAAGTSQPECGVEEKVLIPRVPRWPHSVPEDWIPWSDPIPEDEDWVRCSACLSLHPL